MLRGKKSAAYFRRRFLVPALRLDDAQTVGAKERDDAGDGLGRSGWRTGQGVGQTELIPFGAPKLVKGQHLDPLKVVQLNHKCG